jgi:hypothetical protein
VYASSQAVNFLIFDFLEFCFVRILNAQVLNSVKRNHGGSGSYRNSEGIVSVA